MAHLRCDIGCRICLDRKWMDGLNEVTMHNTLYRCSHLSYIFQNVMNVMLARSKSRQTCVSLRIREKSVFFKMIIITRRRRPIVHSAVVAHNTRQLGVLIVVFYFSDTLVKTQCVFLNQNTKRTIFM